MKLSKLQLQGLCRKVLTHLQAAEDFELKVPEDKVQKKMISIIEQNMQEEAAIDREVNVLLDDLERSNTGEFQRFKMQTLLKKKVAQEKGFVL